MLKPHGKTHRNAIFGVILANQFYQEFLNMPAIMRKILISRKINGVKPSGHFRPFFTTPSGPKQLALVEVSTIGHRSPIHPGLIQRTMVPKLVRAS